MTKRELTKIIKGFKPQFGNQNHIRAMELMKKLDARDRLKKEKGEIVSEMSVLDAEIMEDAKRLKFLIESKN